MLVVLYTDSDVCTFQVRRVMCQVIIAMAHHHYLSLEGGQLMVEFIVRQCAINTEDKVGWSFSVCVS